MKSFTSNSGLTIEQVQAEIAKSSGSQDLADIYQQLTALNNWQVQYQSYISTMSSQVDANTSDISSILARLATAESKITTLQSKVSQLESQVSSLWTEVNALQTLSSTVNANYSYHRAQAETICHVLISMIFAFGMQLNHLSTGFQLFTTEYITFVATGQGSDWYRAKQAWSYPTGSRYEDSRFSGLLLNDIGYRQLLTYRQSNGTFPGTSAFDLVTSMKIKIQNSGNSIVNGYQNTDPVPFKDGYLLYTGDFLMSQVWQP